MKDIGESILQSFLMLKCFNFALGFKTYRWVYFADRERERERGIAFLSLGLCFPVPHPFQFNFKQSSVLIKKYFTENMSASSYIFLVCSRLWQFWGCKSLRIAPTIFSRGEKQAPWHCIAYNNGAQDQKLLSAKCFRSFPFRDSLRPFALISLWSKSLDITSCTNSGELTQQVFVL